MNHHHSKKEPSIYQQILEDKADRNSMSPDARALCRKGFELTLDSIIAIGIGEDPEATPAQKLRAMDQVGKYGYGKVRIVMPNEHFVHILGRVCSRHLPDKEKTRAFLADFMSAVDEHYA